jgi:hypothetical protein
MAQGIILFLMEEYNCIVGKLVTNYNFILCCTIMITHTKLTKQDFDQSLSQVKSKEKLMLNIQ